MAKLTNLTLYMNKTIEIGKVVPKIKFQRGIWNIVYLFLFRPFPTSLFWWWRWFLLRLFGAKISIHSLVYSSVKIWAPWNLRMAAGSCLGDHVICYNQALVELEENATVSQFSYLCTAGHKTNEPNSAKSGLILASITVKKNAWIGTRAFVGMGVEIGENAIVGATASVYKDIERNAIVGGNPAKVLKYRTLK